MITVVITVVVTVVVVAGANPVVLAVVVAVGEPLAPRRRSAEDQRSNVLHRERSDVPEALAVKSSQLLLFFT